MRTITKLKATLSASFDSFVSNVENQEAVINQIIFEIKDALGDIKVRIHETSKTIENSQKNEDGTIRQIEQWQEYAREVHSDSPQKSRECVKRVLSLKKLLESTRLNIQSFEADLANLQADRSHIENKLLEAQSKKAHFLSKQVRSQSLKAVNRINTDDMNDLFNRWENKLIKESVHLGLNQGQAIDSLEKEIQEKELNEKINSELENILKNS